MTREQALDTLTRCAIESREAMAVLRATHPLRPMGVCESETIRLAQAIGEHLDGNEDGVARTGLVAGTSEEPPLAEENGLEFRPAPRPASVFGDLTPPRPQDIESADDPLWQSVMEDER